MKNLKFLREQKGLTQQGLALIVNTTNQSISNWEQQKFMPDLDQLIKLADFFNVSIDYLVGREVGKDFLIKKEYVSMLTNEQKTKIILQILEIISKN